MKWKRFETVCVSARWLNASLRACQFCNQQLTMPHLVLGKKAPACGLRLRLLGQVTSSRQARQELPGVPAQPPRSSAQAPYFYAKIIFSLGGAVPFPHPL